MSDYYRYQTFAGTYGCGLKVESDANIDLHEQFAHWNSCHCRSFVSTKQERVEVDNFNEWYFGDYEWKRGEGEAI